MAWRGSVRNETGGTAARWKTAAWRRLYMEHRGRRDGFAAAEAVARIVALCVRFTAPDDGVLLIPCDCERKPWSCTNVCCSVILVRPQQFNACGRYMLRTFLLQTRQQTQLKTSLSVGSRNKRRCIPSIISFCTSNPLCEVFLWPYVRQLIRHLFSLSHIVLILQLWSMITVN